MKYKLPFRRINDSDLNANCPHLPEEDDFEMYFSALIEDVENINVVLSVTRNGNDLIIETREQDFKIVHTTIKDMLNNQYYTQLKTSSGFTEVQ